MRKVILIITILILKGISAQRFSNFNEEFSDSFVLVNNIFILKQTEANFDKKGKLDKTYFYIKYYDNNGKLNHSFTINDSLKLNKIRHSETYLLKNNNRHITSYDNPAWKRNQIQIYNQNNKVIKSLYFGDKGKLNNLIEYFYNSDNKVIRANTYNRKHKLISYNINEYQNGKLSKSIKYKGNGKFIKHTDYSCDEAGVVINKKKDSVKVCSVRTYYPDGSYMNVVTRVNYFNEPITEKFLYNKDSLIVHYTYLNDKKTNVSSEILYKYEGRIIIEKTSYNVNKSWSYKSIMTFDKNERIISRIDTSINNNKTTVHKFEYTYNLNGLISQRKTFTNGVLRNLLNYDYILSSK